MPRPTIDRVAVVGTGVIGRSWIQVFARAGCQVRVYDPDPAQVAAVLEWIRHDLEADRIAGFITAEQADARRALVSTASGLSDALAGVGYVQECGPEQLEVKHTIFAELDKLAPHTTILASSASALDMTEIAAGLAGAPRCLVAHPVNPPHVVPIVEIVPSAATSSDVVASARLFLSSVGQTPVVLNFYVPGFLLNRMQAALLGEAISLVERGVADVDAVDAVVREGLGLRWALMGPFGVANTNADGGVREYFTRYGAAYEQLLSTFAPAPSFTAELVERLGQKTDAMVGSRPRVELQRWRDRLIAKIRALKDADPQP